MNIPNLHSYTHCQTAQAYPHTKFWERVCPPIRPTDKQTDEEKEAQGATRHLPQWQVTWLIEHSASHQLLYGMENFVQQNPAQTTYPKMVATNFAN